MPSDETKDENEQKESKTKLSVNVNSIATENEENEAVRPQESSVNSDSEPRDQTISVNDEQSETPTTGLAEGAPTKVSKRRRKRSRRKKRKMTKDEYPKVVEQSFGRKEYVENKRVVDSNIPKSIMEKQSYTMCCIKVVYSVTLLVCAMLAITCVYLWLTDTLADLVPSLIETVEPCMTCYAEKVASMWLFTPTGRVMKHLFELIMNIGQIVEQDPAQAVRDEL